MGTFMQDAGQTPGGMSSNRYVKTSEYQVIKLLRQIFYLLGIAFNAIIRLIIDIFKGIVGKS